MNNIIILICLGSICGFFTGFTGISTTGLILAGLSLFNVISDYQTIMGTVLYILIFPVTIISAWQFYINKKINFFVGNILLVSMLVGLYFGSYLVLNSKFKINDKLIKYTTSFIALSMGIYFFISAYYSK